MKTALLLLLISLSTMAQHSLTLTITGVKKAKGEVLVQLIQGQKNYEATPSIAFDTAFVRAAVPSVVVQFPNLPSGEYALKVFHDLDYDRKLKTNRFGMPKEPYGFSNSARGSMGPPTYEQVTFSVTSDTTHTLTIK